MLISSLALFASLMEPSVQANRIRFAPFAVRVTLELARGRQISGCTVQIEGNPDAFWLDDPCRNLALTVQQVLRFPSAQTRSTLSRRLGRPDPAGSPVSK